MLTVTVTGMIIPITDKSLNMCNMMIAVMISPKAVCGGGKVSVPALEDLLLKARPHDCSQPHNYELFLATLVALHLIPL